MKNTCPSSSLPAPLTCQRQKWKHRSRDEWHRAFRVCVICRDTCWDIMSGSALVDTDRKSSAWFHHFASEAAKGSKSKRPDFELLITIHHFDFPLYLTSYFFSILSPHNTLSHLYVSEIFLSSHSFLTPSIIPLLPSQLIFSPIFPVWRENTSKQ